MPNSPIIPAGLGAERGDASQEALEAIFDEVYVALPADRELSVAITQGPPRSRLERLLNASPKWVRYASDLVGLARKRVGEAKDGEIKKILVRIEGEPNFFTRLRLAMLFYPKGIDFDLKGGYKSPKSG